MTVGFALPRRKAILLALKASVMALLLVWLVRMVDWGEFWVSLKDVSPWAFLLVIILNLLAFMVMSLRWMMLIRAAGYSPSYKAVFLYNMLGLFFNQVLPGSISGDAARVWWLANNYTGWKKSVGIVSWGRILGMMALVLIALVFMPFYHEPALSGRGAALVWASLFLVLALFLAARTARGLAIIERLARKLIFRREGSRGRESADWFFSSLSAYLSHRVVVWEAFGLSLLLRGLWISGAAVLSVSMGLPVPPMYYFFCVPLIELIRTVPISIQGLGVRELAFVFFLAPLGVSAANAALLSMLFYTALTVCGLFGGILYLGRGFFGISYQGRIKDVG
jgi:uncharacterized protein (TIRG00374 family)